MVTSQISDLSEAELEANLTLGWELDLNPTPLEANEGLQPKQGEMKEEPYGENGKEGWKLTEHLET
jgi:hypothetical protein